MPWVVAFIFDFSLPAGVRGPVDFWALRRLAFFFHLDGFEAMGASVFRAVSRQVARARTLRDGRSFTSSRRAAHRSTEMRNAHRKSRLAGSKMRVATKWRAARLSA